MSWEDRDTGSMAVNINLEIGTIHLQSKTHQRPYQIVTRSQEEAGKCFPAEKIKKRYYFYFEFERNNVKITQFTVMFAIGFFSAVLLWKFSNTYKSKHI